jgi:hypothetical protein
MTKKIISILALAFAIATPALNINTQAQTPVSFYRVVTATKGVNVRDENCKRIDTVGYGFDFVYGSDQKTINCTISGKSLKMLPFNTPGFNGFIAEMYTAPINYKDFDYGNSYAGDVASYPVLKVNATSGLNLRDYNCKRVTTLKYGTKVSAFGHTDDTRICKAQGTYHAMTRVLYNGDIYYLASSYLDQIK